MQNMLTKTRLLLCGTALTGVIWAGTFATFTDSGTAGSTFTAGTVDLLVSGETDDSYAFTSIEMGNMKPGDVKYAPLTVANNGTLGFSYTMATSATNGDSKGLRDELTLESRTVANAAACDSAGVGFNASLTTVAASGPLSAAAISSRTLVAGTSEVLCFKVQLPSNSGDAFQGATTVATFTFSATQS
jgi:spore coat-associated protein N